MLYCLTIIGVFLLAFRWFAPDSALATLANIPGAILSGLFAMNFFEVMGQWAWLNSFPLLVWEPDLLCFLALFLGAVAGLKELFRNCLAKIRLPDPYEFHVRVWSTIAVSYLVLSVTLTACDTSPLMQKALSITPDSGVLPLVLAPDAQWLSLVRLIEGGSLARPRPSESDLESQATPVSESPPRQSVRAFRSRFVPVTVNYLEEQAGTQ